MKKIQDNFSKQAGFYKKYRPTYPTDLINDIVLLTKNRDSCWDCGTGNGQVALELSKHFKSVAATDISANQIERAVKKENIQYGVERSEATSFTDGQFDLITVAQALHWFDFKAFNTEMNRVCKPGGIVAIWGYGLLRIKNSIDGPIDGFYSDIIGPYWNKERSHVDDQYASIPLDFKEIALKKDYEIKTEWSLRDLEGYFNSWSSVQHYIAKHKKNPVDELIGEIGKHWGSTTKHNISFPIFTRIGSIEK